MYIVFILESDTNVTAIDVAKKFNNYTNKVAAENKPKQLQNNSSFDYFGEARYILLASTYRSGSSLLGALLSQYPGTFYTYEPLMMIDRELKLKSDTKKIYSEKTKRAFIRLLLEVFKCRPDKRYFPFFTAHWPIHFKFNFRLWNVCQGLCPGCIIKKTIKKCSLFNLYYSTCPRFPIRLIKTVRLRIEETEKLLLNSDIGKSLKVIFLVRDPRGMIKSRLAQKWCTFPLCYDPSLFCKDLLTDILAAYKLKEKYPSKLRLIMFVQDFIVYFIYIYIYIYIYNLLLNNFFKRPNTFNSI